LASTGRLDCRLRGTGGLRGQQPSMETVSDHKIAIAAEHRIGKGERG
jgi:hypothetical protein